MTMKPAKSNAALPKPGDLQGSSVDGSDATALREAVELALHYRGDVTITRRSNALPIEGYIFDCQHAAGAGKADANLVIRMIPRDTDDRVRIPFSDIATLAFTGKDTASGKSFENWIKKYAQKKMAGEVASIESESLD